MFEAMGNQSSPHCQDCGESLSLMMEQERAAYACSDYLGRSHHGGGGGGGGGDGAAVTPGDRARLVDWCYDIVDHCRFDREVVAAAANLADRFMSRQDCPETLPFLRDRDRYQLLMTTGLYVSIKLAGPSVLSSEDFSLASRGAYSREDIERTESLILRVAGWRLRGPTPLQAGYRILELMARHVRGQAEGSPASHEAPLPWDYLREELEYQTEVAVRDFPLAAGRPSSVAAAAILNAVEGATDDVAYRRLRYALMFVVEELDFDPPAALSMVKDRLAGLVEENEEDDGGVEDGPEDAWGGPPPVATRLTLEEIKDLCDKAQESWVRRQLSASGDEAMADADMDDDSCATVY